MYESDDEGFRLAEPSSAPMWNPRLIAIWYLAAIRLLASAAISTAFTSGT